MARGLEVGSQRTDMPSTMTPVWADTGFIFWGSAYVIVKWTVGLWAFRRVTASSLGRPSPAPKG
jgi:hypothetical protein